MRNYQSVMKFYEIKILVIKTNSNRIFRTLYILKPPPGHQLFIPRGEIVT